MAKRPLCFFLAFRLSREGGPVHWDNPTGGLVMEPARVVGNFPVSDFGLARLVLEDRYHCAPSEQLLIAEVFEPDEKIRAISLHEQWEREMHSFLELMASS